MTTVETERYLRAALQDTASPVLTTADAVRLAAAVIEEVERRLLTITGKAQEWETVTALAKRFHTSYYDITRTITANEKSIRTTRTQKGWTRYNVQDIYEARKRQEKGMLSA